MDFSVTYSFRSFHDPGVDSAPCENKYQEHLLGVKAAGAWGWQPHHLNVPNVMKSWSLNILEPSGSHRTIHRTSLPFFTYISMYARTKRCYNEGGSGTSYVRYSTPHCIYNCSRHKITSLRSAAQVTLPSASAPKIGGRNAEHSLPTQLNLSFIYTYWGWIYTGCAPHT